MASRYSLHHALIAATLVGCSGGRDWVEGAREAEAPAPQDGWIGPESEIFEKARPSAPGGGAAEPHRAAAGRLFRNTYYDFPREGAGDKKATLFDGSCTPITKVTQQFHDEVCMQGSGRLATGETVSFAKRDCPCAAVCPRSGSKICFDKLDPKSFPTGRGAAGKPVEPLRSVAVDSDVVPLGEVLFVAEYAGLVLPDGRTLDGCFRADDRGSKVVGEHVDLFTGDPEMTRTLNQLIPSNQGVLVEIGARRCAHLKRAAN